MIFNLIIVEINYVNFLKDPNVLCYMQVTGGKNQKSVLVAVFVERPRKRRLLPSNGGGGNHYHHHHHLHLHQSHKQRGSSNRRAELLDYSRRLRDSAPNTPKHHHQTKPASVSSIIQQPINQVHNPNLSPSYTTPVDKSSKCRTEEVSE